jgi:hypothetical protein
MVKWYTLRLLVVAHRMSNLTVDHVNVGEANRMLCGEQLFKDTEVFDCICHHLSNMEFSNQIGRMFMDRWTFSAIDG